MMNGLSSDDPWRDPDFEQAVRDTAYFLWEEDHRPEGREQEYWFRALEKCLRQRNLDHALGEEPKTFEALGPNASDD
jgi:hypothetical protein